MPRRNPPFRNFELTPNVEFVPQFLNAHPPQNPHAALVRVDKPLPFLNTAPVGGIAIYVDAPNS